jgi:hypothetical protein
MQDNIALAMEASRLCRKYQAEYSFSINGSVEAKVTKKIPKGYYYQWRGNVRWDELDMLEYRLKYQKAPD